MTMSMYCQFDVSYGVRKAIHSKYLSNLVGHVVVVIIWKLVLALF